jgi:hypothetical protein
MKMSDLKRPNRWSDYRNVAQCGNSSKNQPRKVSESIHAIFRFLDETSNVVGPRYLKVRGF